MASVKLLAELVLRELKQVLRCRGLKSFERNKETLRERLRQALLEEDESPDSSVRSTARYQIAHGRRERTDELVPGTSGYAEQISRTAARVVANRNVKLVNQDRFDLYLGPLGINISNFYEALEQKLLDFLTFTDIRIQLIQPFTDARGLYDAYYYAISDVQAVARCYCNLHAADCNYTSQGITCDCQHNTMGKNCELCQPLYNERPWKKGSYIPYPRGQANECLKCECNDHAVSCTYNATYGRGVCDACLHNTRGYHCELCALTFYPNVSLPQNDVNRCIDCACEPLGVDGGNLNCSQTDTVGTVIGQCPCKQYVTSRKCDTCVSGYYGLLTGPTPGTCVACTCVQDGTVDQSINCTQDTGQCTCKQTITGRTCDTCRDGYYSFPTGNPQKECSNCNCDKGGAVSPVCDKVTGVCACRANITEAKCTLPAKGTYVPSLDTLIYQPVTGGCRIISDLYTDQTPFDGTSFAVCDLFNGTVSVDFEPVVGGHVQKNIQWPYILAVRYSTNSSALSGTVKLQVSGNTTADLTLLSLQLGQAISPVCPFIGQTEQVDIKFTPGKSLAVLSQPQNVTIDARCAYNLTLLLYSTETSLSGNLSATVNGVSSSGSMITIDSLLLLPTLTSADGATSFGVYVAAENKTITQEMYLTCLQQLSSLLTRQITLTTSCHDILFSVGAELFNGSKSCGCQAISSVTTIACQELGGQCQCKSGVSGQTCDICTPGYFNFTDNGCSPCNCHPKGAETGSCDPNGRCSCKKNILQGNVTSALDNNGTSIRIDGTCSHCLPNYFGIESGQGCSPCNCSVDGSTSLQCDETGQCPCKDTVTGLKCDACKDGFYGFGPNGCSSCNCSSSGSLNVTCHQITGACNCRNNVEGSKCNLCKAGFFNLAETNPKGCQPCFCFNHSNYCTSAVGYVAKLLQVANPSGDFTALFGDRHWSYGQLLTIKFTSTWNIDLSNQIILSLSGSGKVVHYIAPNSTVIGPSGSLSLVIRLLEQNWMMDGPESSIQPTAQDFLALLANLSAVTPITFWNGQPIVTSYIGLDWAEIKVGTTLAEINFVENCICSNTSHTAGMSCQRCSRGYRKEDLSNISSFSQCVACNCSKRGITDPPDCEESTGKCLDCRNGTTGNHCEMCAAHVIGPECDTCESTFWGLQADGCRDCNCSDPGATSNVCNTTSGQCTCATNVVGRACDQCQENFYNLTQAGCIECDSCYSLLKEAILPLHQLESDISSNVSALQANSVNTTFMTRYWEASNQTKQLTDFLTSMQLSEAVIKSNVYELNRTLLSLQTELDFMQHNSTVDIERLMTFSDSTLQIALSYRSVIENNTVTVYNKLASLQVSQAKLSSLASSLKTVEQYLMMVASSSLVDQQIVNELSTLNNTLFLANQLLTSAQQKSEAANQIHKNNTSILLALDTRINALVSGAIKSLANAHKLANTSNDLLSTASNLKSKLSQFVNFKLDSASLASKMSETKSMTSSYQSQVVAESALFNTSNVNALTTVPIADNMSNSTRTLGLTAADWKNRASVASQKALSSQATASNMLQEANKTLLTLINFTAKVQDSMQQVSALNVSLTSALTMSEQLILQSQTVTQTLAQLQQTASEAKLTAQQALGIIMIRQEEFRSVSMLSGQIQNKLNNSVDLSADRFRILTNTRLNILQPAVLQCSDLNSSVSNFKVQLSSAQLAVDRSYIQFANLTEQANSIIAQLNSLNKISPASVVALITNVQSAKELNLDELRMIISDLKTKKTAQKQQIDDLKLKRDDLNLKIQVLKAFQDQINKK
ncbi:laminin subunit alpha-5-like [Biomphalaria glabrata]|uniref:Laminin subunit alpha-5-like n=1 Tax=Biomphalaria glabrata TaxID=6526 RepID=A0A9U8EAY1_BIOGL|nr:laminin subunit alpha-5-like [Biomphalaria glabrata]